MTNKELRSLLSTPEREYLEAMKRTGLYGGTLSEVIRDLILTGIRDAIDRGFIELRTFTDLDADETK